MCGVIGLTHEPASFRPRLGTQLLNQRDKHSQIRRTKQCASLRDKLKHVNRLQTGPPYGQFSKLPLRVVVADQLLAAAVRERNTLELLAAQRVKRMRDHEALSVIVLNRCSSTGSPAAAGSG